MAVKDVKRYYYAMLNQYLEMKADLADFEQAFADGFITEDQLEAVKEDIIKIEANYDRLTYIMYLLEMPNRDTKKAGYKAKNQKLALNFENKAANQAQVELENKSALDHLRSELKKLTEADN
jgi:hypothetical protein